MRCSIWLKGLALVLPLLLARPGALVRATEEGPSSVKEALAAFGETASGLFALLIHEVQLFFAGFVRDEGDPSTVGRPRGVFLAAG